MKKVLLVILACMVAVGLASSQVRVAAKYTPPFITGTPVDSVLNGLTSIRGVTFHPNPEGNGKGAIAVTNYAGSGRVSVFEVVGNDSINLVWTSPSLPNSGGSTPRNVLFADLDKDGKIEVIFFLNTGVYIFEHDGVAGSHNYGTTYSQVIKDPNIKTSTALATEYIEVADVDNDGTPEFLSVANYTGSTLDRYYIIRANGDWSTNDPGFSSFTTEFDSLRGNCSKWGLNGGSPASMVSAQLDGTGAREIVVQAWDRKSVTVLRSTAANTYAFPDTNNTGKLFVRLGGANDDVALFGGFAYDIDGDGREEVYLPTYPTPAGGPHSGWLHMISYNAGEQTDRIDSALNTTIINMSSVVGTSDMFGYGYGDIDGNGKKNIYISCGSGRNVVSVEFQGGDKRLAANWQTSLLFAGEALGSVLDSVRYKDSLGVKDTLKYNNPVFVSKMFARNTDFDKDGIEDMILPYQAFNDSIVVRRVTWNTGTVKYDTVRSKIVNPNRSSLKIVEKGGATGVEVKDLTVITPDQYRLDQNYPNPFNPSTTINFYLPVRERISMKIYDVLGREVRTLINGEDREKGEGSVVWDGKNNAGQPVGSGTYFYTMKFGNFEKTSKMMLLK